MNKIVTTFMKFNRAEKPQTVNRDAGHVVEGSCLGSESDSKSGGPELTVNLNFDF